MQSELRQHSSSVELFFYKPLINGVLFALLGIKSKNLVFAPLGWNLVWDIV